MPTAHQRGALVVLGVLAASLVAMGQDGALKRRLTPAEVEMVRADNSGAGTSGLQAVNTRVLFGDPTKRGLYAIELRVAPNTTIEAHTHRDMRTAVVLDGVWQFGYGTKNEPRRLKVLTRGAFYTEPGGEAHFAKTGPEGATVVITGYGPTDTHFVR
jgi:hypothetical protein